MNDIKRNLGYRFELQQGSFTNLVKPGNGMTVQFSILNKGNASLFNPRNVELILTETTTGEKYFCKLPDDPRFWKPDSIVYADYLIGIKSSHPNGTFRLSINLPDAENLLHDRKEYSVRFANQNVWDAATGYNNLGVNVFVDNSAAGQQYNGELWFEPLMPTSTEDEINSLEKGKTELRIQSFPNPFNNSTQIKIEVAESSNISLKLFNVLGEQVDSIINDYRLKGEYQINYNSNNLSSGVYYCILSSEKNSISSKIMLIK
jgi:hypothetical protein